MSNGMNLKRTNKSKDYVEFQPDIQLDSTELEISMLESRLEKLKASLSQNEK